MGLDEVRYQVVELMPPTIDEGVLYISLEFMTAVHRCCCGCGERVVTPISPTDWSVTFHGNSVSLHPSVGNWGLACGSHYIIHQSRVEWAPRWPQHRIDQGRLADRLAKQRQFTPHLSPAALGASSTEQPVARRRRTSRLWRWFRRRGQQ